MTFRLNWLAYGFHAPFYYGVAQGIYRAHGIDLVIGEGQGSGRAVQAVAAGSDMFGLADGTAIVGGAAHGAPVQAVMGIMNRSPNGVIVRKDSGIKDLKGLEGQTIAATTGEVGLVVFPAVLRSQKLPAESVRVLRVDGATKIVAVLEKRAVGVLGGIENQALIAAKPTLETGLALAQLRTGMPLMQSSYGANRPLGWMAPEDWASTIALMTEYQGLQTSLPASAFWTDAFIPQ